ncbi:putative Acyltransferase [Leishmania shawi]|uniref:Acyltransferase n=2 Tax=Viannia TaxID=37616 RepID=A0AAW3CEL4_9TRYP
MHVLSWLIFVAVYGVFLRLLRERKVPLIVMRVWHTFHLVLCVIMSWIGAMVLHLLEKAHLLDIATMQSLTRCVCVITFGYWLRFNSPHIRVEHLPGSLLFSSITVQHDLCLCHTSFFDTILFLWCAPFRYIYKVKSFAKASLLKLPLFGTVIAMCGHFLVHFVSTEATSFSVNREKQMAVAADVEDFLSKGGSLCLFPEGVLNRTPEVLKDFRLGSFNTILKHKLPLYYCVTYGNHEVWSPSLKGVPGYPADIYVYIGKYEYDADKVDAQSLASGLREEMQKHISKMMLLREKRGYKPWCVAPHTD